MQPPRPDPVRIALESKIADLERLVETLNEVLVEQDRTLDAITGRVTVLERRLATSAGPREGEARSLEDDRPPHY